ncbi:pH-sensitive chloride channel 2-like [Coccinella septempunctata]|uniref:pH-sensitive chloride channel 2-like n=1 Tax=Coccinella septempunctata TaxID=41139 RepID=UPI001D084324|nr:pH-sensitive chloride channel 2-like [Coccinella septempunctata]
MFGGTYPMKIQMFFAVLCLVVFCVDFCYTMVDGSILSQPNLYRLPNQINETRQINPDDDFIYSTQNDISTTSLVSSRPQPPSKIIPTENPVRISEPTAKIENMEITPTPIAIRPAELPEPIDHCGKLSIEYMSLLTQEQFINKLTEPCRYDKLVKPHTDGPLDVYLQVDLRHIEAIDSLQFKAHMVLQYSYRDARLDFRNISKNRETVMGQEILRDKIWVPHVIVRNEKDTVVMGSDGKDVFVTISASGQVTYSYRMTLTFYCWMNLKKFPFDIQLCDIIWNSWAYNTTNLLLHWKSEVPVKIAKNLHLTEFVLTGNWTEVGQVPVTFAEGGRVGNYSSLIFKFQLSREVGYYILDYFLPSILLVCTSWVTFWLQADASPPRATLGTSTMLAFITLNGGVTKNLPKVSYIKASEIWFLGCVCFIFSSMAEFAFVNVIWRRKKKVEMKKANPKHILKGALTPSLARKQLRKAESENNLFKSYSTTSLDGNNFKNSQHNYLTVHGFHTIPSINTQNSDECLKSDDSVTSIPIPDDYSGQPQNYRQQWHTMTPQEVANWIDKKSRIVFPLSFLVFNIFYWSFVYAL